MHPIGWRLRLNYNDKDMTQEQYDTVVSINNRLKELYRVQEEIKVKHDHKLTYTYKRSHGEDSICCSLVMSAIDDILDRHDLMIRQEIQDAIDQLKKQIEEL